MLFCIIPWLKKKFTRQTKSPIGIRESLTISWIQLLPSVPVSKRIRDENVLLLGCATSIVSQDQHCLTSSNLSIYQGIPAHQGLIIFLYQCTPSQYKGRDKLNSRNLILVISSSLACTALQGQHRLACSPFV